MNREKTQEVQSESARDSHIRSVLKAITWRFLATSTTFIIAWLVIGELPAAVTIAGFEVVAKMIIYYLHERAWALVPRGWMKRLWRKRASSKEGPDHPPNQTNA